MFVFLSNFGSILEDFFATSAMTAIGAAFLVIISLLTLFLMRYFEK